MAEPENKDKIKEILEGHNKKFTTTELIVGIIVLLIIGCGIGYAIFKLLTPAPNQIPPTSTVTAVQQPAIPQSTEEENTAVNEETKQTQPPVVQNNTSENEEENQYQNVENNTAQNAVAQNSEQNQIGPNIIPPTSTTNQIQKQPTTKPNEEAKKQTLQTKRAVSKTSKATATKRVKTKRHIKKHVYTRVTKYYIQVSSNKNRKLALLNVIKLRKCGHNAFTKEVKIKGVKYTRVYVGPIKGYTLAKEEAKEIKKQLHLGYLPLIKKDD